MNKNLIYISLLSIVACNKLDVSPEGSISSTQYYQTEADAIAAVNAVYGSLTYEASDQSLYGRNLYFLTDMGTDYAAAGASAINANVRAISALSYDANNDRVALAWKQIYRGIDRANLAIDNIPSTTASDDVKARLVNEAKFIRALLYFDAVQLWGPVPLVLHQTESLDASSLKSTRTSRDSIYAQIVSDLTDALALPATYSGSNIGRATSGAAYSLLAKVYLARKDYANAIQYARSVIDSRSTYGYDLFTNFYDAFDPSTKNGEEHIFSAQFTTGQSGTSSSTGNTFPACSFNGFSQVETADIVSDVSFYNLYQDADQRKKGSYSTGYLNPGTSAFFAYTGKPRFRKYVDTTYFTSLQAYAPVNFPIIRYADVLLVLAEAINEQSGPTDEAYESINEVRRRAFGYDIYTSGSTVDLSGLSQSQFRDSLRQERLLEFVQEGQRWFDLVRWGTLLDATKSITGKTGVTARDTLYPIPQSLRDINPDGLWQNAGY
ncbi:MAG: RagB/SusD family nutrient uptake outer membrane protein [Chitinophagaceae bacterium]